MKQSDILFAFEVFRRVFKISLTILNMGALRVVGIAKVICLSGVAVVILADGD